MITTAYARSLTLGAAAALAAVLGGCVTYTQGELSKMSVVDICELELWQRPNLSPEGRQAIQGELARRNDNCRNHAEEVTRRYDRFMFTQMYPYDSP